MKIAIILNTAWNIANFRAGLIKSLVDSEHDVLAVAPVDGFVKDIEELGVHFIPIQMDSHSINPFKDMSLFFDYLRIFRAEKVDCILTYTIKPNIYASLAARILNIKVINNISGLGTLFIRKTFLTGLVTLLYRLALNRSQHVFFQNGDDLDLFLLGGLVGETNSSIIPGSGVDLRRFSVSPLPHTSDNQTVKFLFIGRLLADKGINEYFQASENLKNEYPEVTCQILGGHDENNPRSIAKALLNMRVQNKVVNYLGEVRDVRPFIAEADCIVLPSYREGLPRVLLEAAAMARPVIATDVEGCRDVIVHGVTGLLCKARDWKMLAHSMKKYINMPLDQRIKMGLRAREKVEQEFDEKLVINSYMRIINRLDH